MGSLRAADPTAAQSRAWADEHSRLGTFILLARQRKAIMEPRNGRQGCFNVMMQLSEGAQCLQFEGEVSSTKQLISDVADILGVGRHQIQIKIKYKQHTCTKCIENRYTYEHELQVTAELLRMRKAEADERKAGGGVSEEELMQKMYEKRRELDHQAGILWAIEAENGILEQLSVSSERTVTVLSSNPIRGGKRPTHSRYETPARPTPLLNLPLLPRQWCEQTCTREGGHITICVRLPAPCNTWYGLEVQFAWAEELWRDAEVEERWLGALKGSETRGCMVIKSVALDSKCRTNLKCLQVPVSLVGLPAEAAEIKIRARTWWWPEGLNRSSTKVYSEWVSSHAAEECAAHFGASSWEEHLYCDENGERLVQPIAWEGSGGQQQAQQHGGCVNGDQGGEAASGAGPSALAENGGRVEGEASAAAAAKVGGEGGASLSLARDAVGRGEAVRRPAAADHQASPRASKKPRHANVDPSGVKREAAEGLRVEASTVDDIPSSLSSSEGGAARGPRSGNAGSSAPTPQAPRPAGNQRQNNMRTQPSHRDGGEQSQVLRQQATTRRSEVGAVRPFAIQHNLLLPGPSTNTLPMPLQPPPCPPATVPQAPEPVPLPPLQPAPLPAVPAPSAVDNGHGSSGSASGAAGPRAVTGTSMGGNADANGRAVPLPLCIACDACTASVLTLHREGKEGHLLYCDPCYKLLAPRVSGTRRMCLRTCGQDTAGFLQVPLDKLEAATRGSKCPRCSARCLRLRYLRSCKCISTWCVACLGNRATPWVRDECGECFAAFQPGPHTFVDIVLDTQ